MTSLVSTHLNLRDVQVFDKPLYSNHMYLDIIFQHNLVTGISTMVPLVKFQWTVDVLFRRLRGLYLGSVGVCILISSVLTNFSVPVLCH